LFKLTLIAAALIAASVTSFAQTAATPVPAKSATVVAPAAVPASAAAVPVKPAAAAAAAAAAAPAAKTADAEPAVKKSNNNICHDQTSAGYKATKNFKPFATMDECIKSGGRAPKVAEPKAKK